VTNYSDSRNRTSLMALYDDSMPTARYEDLIPVAPIYSPKAVSKQDSSRIQIAVALSLTSNALAMVDPADAVIVVEPGNSMGRKRGFISAERSTKAARCMSLVSTQSAAG
jgi:hypothetical protein